MENNIKYAKDEKCCVCGEQAVAYWPIIDPDIPAHPYCRKCLDKTKVAFIREIMLKDFEKK